MGNVIDMDTESSLSIVIPVYNEEENLPILLDQLEKELQKYKYEIVVVDDGSSDDSLQVVLGVQKRNNRVKAIKLYKNYGQTAAIDAGFSAAKNDIVVTLDADLQNPVQDIHKLINGIKEGSDVVCGWRVNRNDTFGKKLMSRLAYRLRKAVLNDPVHDAGCTLRAYRREILNGLSLFGEMHRFIHVILRWRGCSIIEIPVGHNERRYGKTKYGFSRIFKGVLDLIVVKFWLDYSSRPIYIFGGLGLGLTSIGLALAVYMAALKVLFEEALSNRPLLLLAIFLMVIGTQFIFFGLLADVMTKLYYDHNKSKYYVVAKTYE